MRLTEHTAVELDKAQAAPRIRTFVQEIAALFESKVANEQETAETLASLLCLTRFEVLSPLTSAPDEWELVEGGAWQNRRRTSTYSRDGGKTWYDTLDSSWDRGDSYTQEFWAPVQLGSNYLKSGLILRVKEDAYSGVTAGLHNGKRGTYATARNGYVYVTYEGTHDPVPHKAQFVERLVKTGV